MTAPRYALLSVSDKTGLADFGRGLVEAGFTLLSTGGTARVLAQAGVAVTKVSDHTGFPEIMQGRVKTLHPKIHGGILGRRSAHAAEAQAHDIGWIDVVVVNLYPFVQTIQREGVTVDEAIEQIDIGGPTMVRSAAKNHGDVTVVVDPSDYAVVLAELAEGGAVSAATRRRLAGRAFAHTAAYDGAIATWMAGLEPEGGRVALPGVEGGLPIRREAALRYGENPHQRATFYAEPVAQGRSLARLTQLGGKQLSFNNLADLDAALRAVFEFSDPACVIVKHANPCGAASHTGGLAQAFTLALSADPVSAFGGIVVWNRPVDKDAIVALRKARLKFEIIAAPGFSPDAREAFPPKEKGVRILELPADWTDSRPSGFDAKRVQGGWLLQDWDIDAEIGWTVASDRAPTADEASALRFAWRVCRSVKSNAIVLARAADGGFVANGVGAGQMSRVDSTRIAISKATREVAGSVLASDAFFPFPDAVEIALKEGVTAFIQPGGALRDPAVLEAVNAAGATMVFTGQRHFRH